MICPIDIYIYIRERELKKIKMGMLKKKERFSKEGKEGKLPVLFK